MAKTINFGTVTVALPVLGQAEPIMAATNPDRFTTDFWMFAPSSNVGASFYWGDENVDNTWIPIPKETIINVSHGNGDKNLASQEFDLSKIYIAGSSAGDNVIVQYIKSVMSED